MTSPLIDDSEMDTSKIPVPESNYTPDWYEKYGLISREMLLNAYRDNNTMCSPFSLYMLMCMAVNATEGKTQKEIQDAFFQSGSSQTYITNEMKRIQSEFTKQMKGGKLISSNAVFVKKEYSKLIKEEYKSLVEDTLLGKIFSDEKNLVEASNSWVKEKTEGMISEALEEEPEICALMNALAFKVKWKVKYESEAIIEDDIFYDFDENEFDCISLLSEENYYIEDSYFKGFIRDYKGERYAFMGLLPKKSGKKAFKEAIQNADYLGLFKNAIKEEVDVLIPEFEITSDANLIDFCQRLGIKTLFTEEADFGGMIKDAPLMVNSILQKAYISVDRNGTKAAALTGMCVCAGCAPEENERKEVYLSRPFVYAIVEKKTGLPVFIGTVTNC